MINIDITTKQFNIFWTGGFDSTFLLLYFQENTNDDCIIIPIYISSQIDKRKSILNEINTINKIHKILKNKYKSKLKEVVFIDKIVLDDQILELNNLFYENLNQYTYIAQVCKNMKINGCVAIVGDDKNWKKDKILFKNSSKASFDMKNKKFILFENFRVPLIKICKEQILKYCETNDFFNDILNQTWTCWFPIYNIPCKKCKMCHERLI